MVRALRVVTVERGVDPRRFALLAFGGAGGLHAAAIAEELGIRRILVPRASGVLSALGLAAADRRAHRQRSVLLRGAELTDRALAREAQALAGAACDALRDGDAHVDVAWDVRYRGQSHELTLRGVSGEVAALRDGECDVAFVWLPADLTGLRSELVASEQRYAGLASGHRLAGRAQLSVNELNDEPIMWTRLAPRYWVDWWAVNPRPDGSEPRWGPENDNVEEMLEQVADGSAYCIAPASMTEYYARPDLAWVPITDIDPLRIALAWRERDGSPLVAAFAGVVRELVD
jgi:DNA-binding transcriptional LysR family regulator